MTTPTTPPTERPQCTALKPSGERCGITFGLSPTGLCLQHDPARRPIADAGRAKARLSTRPGDADPAPTPNGAKYRTLPPARLGGRPARTLREQARQVSLVQFAVVTGAVDPATAREFFRGATTHRELLKLLDHERRLKAVERELKRLRT